MEKEMRALYIEGVAIRGGPESCVDDLRGRGEALTGVRAGRAMEPRNQRDRGADVVLETEGNTAGGVSASRQWAPRGRRTRACASVSMCENREIPRLARPGDVWSGRLGNAEA